MRSTRWGSAVHRVQLSTPRAAVPGGWCAWRATAARSRLYDPRVGQTRAQKAAKAARGQQPKKRPGKAQREAIKRAQAAKKKAGGGKPAAKKTTAKKAVPLPRGSVRAAYPGACPACFKDYTKGEVITKVTDRWGHPACAARQMSAAEREFATRAGSRAARRSAARSHSPFNEWDTIFNEPRLCAAIADRITFRCTLIQTGTDSYRFQATEAERGTNKAR